MGYGLGSKGNPFYSPVIGASGRRYADLDAVEELELWHQVWDDTVLETLDYVAATEAADKAIHFRTPSAFGPGQVIAYNPLKEFYIGPTGAFAATMMADYRRKTRMIDGHDIAVEDWDKPHQGAKKTENGRDWIYAGNNWIMLPTPGMLKRR